MNEQDRVSGREVFSFIKEIWNKPAIAWSIPVYAEVEDDDSEIKMLRRKVRLLEKQKQMLLKTEANPRLTYKIVK